MFTLYNRPFFYKKNHLEDVLTFFKLEKILTSQNLHTIINYCRFFIRTTNLRIKKLTLINNDNIFILKYYFLMHS